MSIFASEVWTCCLIRCNYRPLSLLSLLEEEASSWGLPPPPSPGTCSSSPIFLSHSVCAPPPQKGLLSLPPPPPPKAKLPSVNGRSFQVIWIVTSVFCVLCSERVVCHTPSVKHHLETSHKNIVDHEAERT